MSLKIAEPHHQPLAARLRPRTADEFVGQHHLMGEGKPLRVAMEQRLVHSMILWGPPGCGKTTLARMLVDHADARIEQLSAVLAGVKDIREVVERAKVYQPQQTVLFVDEVHRFNKAQQDAFLPFVEDGTLTLIGATTENPSFALNNALLSRTRVFVLKAIAPEALRGVLQRGLAALNCECTDEVADTVLHAADGDARQLLNIVEMAADFARIESDSTCRITHEHLAEVLGAKINRFDKGGDYFYDQISALHKSVRGSSPDAALYWLSRMLTGGCDPHYVARRVVRMASEDIGNADPRALSVAIDAWQTYERVGSPEGEIAIAQAVVYLACCPKSNAVYTAFNAAWEDAKRFGSLEVPTHLRNAPTKLMKELGYGKDYRYAHDEPDAFAQGETYFPDDMGEQIYYEPVDRGLEIKIAEKLKKLRD